MNGRLRRILFENFALKVISLVLAVLLYVLLRSVQSHDDPSDRGAVSGVPEAEQTRSARHGR
jgi:hypothetical protein